MTPATAGDDQQDRVTDSAAHWVAMKHGEVVAEAETAKELFVTLHAKKITGSISQKVRATAARHLVPGAPKPKSQPEPPSAPPTADQVHTTAAHLDVGGPGVASGSTDDRPTTAAQLSDHEVNTLATYNAEVARGLVHTAEWAAQMAALQERFDAYGYVSAERDRLIDKLIGGSQRA